MQIRWVIKEVRSLDYTNAGYGGKGEVITTSVRTLQSFNDGKWTDVPSYNEDELINGGK